jgi:hypothetical protein
MDQNDIKSLPRNTQILLATTVLAFIFTFLPFDGVHVSGVGADRNAWHGFTGVVGSLLVLVTLVVVLLQTFAAQNLPSISMSWNVVAFATSALATLFYILRWLFLPSEKAFGVTISDELQWAGYILIILCAVTAVFAFLRTKEAGDAMPWDNRGGGAAPPPPAA